LPVDKDDPEKRIAELERRLTDTNTEQGAQEFPLPAAQPEFRPPRPRRRYPAILFSAIVLLAFAGCATALVVYFKPSSDTQLQTAEGLTGLLNEVRDHFGDTMGYELAVHPERAFIQRVNPQENRAEQRYQYRSGDWTEFGDPTPSSGSKLTDLSKFDAAGVAAALASAPQTLTITNPKNIYLIVESDGSDNLSLAIHVSGGGISGHMEINPDGTIKEIYPPS
jgi:hypothetical protein